MTKPRKLKPDRVSNFRLYAAKHECRMRKECRSRELNQTKRRQDQFMVF
jgi:hypothetical protein